MVARRREEDLNSGPPDYKSSALTTRPRLKLSLIKPVNCKETDELQSNFNLQNVRILDRVYAV